MDGVLADFDSAIIKLCPDLRNPEVYPSHESRSVQVDKVCEANPNIFYTLQPIKGAIEAAYKLFDSYNVYFLSTAMWHVPESFTGKRVWIQSHFGKLGEKRLILTHRKDLVIGDYLVDDRIKNGSGNFKGAHIHFGTPRYPSWDVVLPYLESIA